MNNSIIYLNITSFLITVNIYNCKHYFDMAINNCFRVLRNCSGSTKNYMYDNNLNVSYNRTAIIQFWKYGENGEKMFNSTCKEFQENRRTSFTKYRKKGKYKRGNWVKWHKRVLTKYGRKICIKCT